MQQGGGVEHLQPGDPAVVPVEHDHGVHPFGWVDRDALAAGQQLFVGEVDVGGVGVVGDTHA